jgi:hypothetical protein
MIDITGPLGGIIAAAYGAGCIFGYGFASKTFGKQMKQLRGDMKDDKDDCDRRIHDLTERLRTVEDRSFNSLERQAAQVRESAVHVIRGGKIIPPIEDI